MASGSESQRVREFGSGFEKGSEMESETASARVWQTERESGSESEMVFEME